MADSASFLHTLLRLLFLLLISGSISVNSTPLHSRKLLQVAQCIKPPCNVDASDSIAHLTDLLKSEHASRSSELSVERQINNRAQSPRVPVRIVPYGSRVSVGLAGTERRVAVSRGDVLNSASVCRGVENMEKGEAEGGDNLRPWVNEKHEHHHHHHHHHYHHGYGKHHNSYDDDYEDDISNVANVGAKNQASVVGSQSSNRGDLNRNAKSQTNLQNGDAG